jgi:hypothetical protein
MELGYGLVSECIAHKRPILYVLRNAFPEEVLLVGSLGAEGIANAEVGNRFVLWLLLFLIFIWGLGTR